MRANPLKLTNDKPIEEQLGCFGYFGFGGGVALALYGTASDTGQTYCGRCSKSAPCWQRHRERVRTIVPDLCALADDIAQTHKGQDYIREFLRRTKQVTGKFAEPYLAVMMGNIDDGAHVATMQRPKDRGEGSLTWPLTPLSENLEKRRESVHLSKSTDSPTKAAQ